MSKHRAAVRTRTFTNPAEILGGLTTLDVATVLGLALVAVTVVLGVVLHWGLGVVGAHFAYASLGGVFAIAVVGQVASIVFGDQIGRFVEKRLNLTATAG